MYTVNILLNRVCPLKKKNRYKKSTHTECKNCMLEHFKVALKIMRMLRELQKTKIKKFN